jgi:hypothetical protein
MRQFFLPVVAVFLDATYAASPYVMTWSTQAYGPDGPWQAVTIEVGSEKQSIALYPGANYASRILLDSICSNKTLSSTCYAAEAGTYNQNKSTTAHVLSTSSWETVYWAVAGGAIESVIGDQFNFGPTVPNASIQGVYQTYETYPNGKSYPVQVGTLALGAPWSTDTLDNATLNMIASWLYTSGGDDAIPSYSYGMHIGSVSPAIAPSLVLGGYDSSRVLGDVSAQSVSLDPATSGQLDIIIKDIGLGLAGGWTPPGFASKDGLLLQNNGGTGPTNVTIDPTVPYMYLAGATCDAITASLPISFDKDLGLYLWDTTDSNYANITSSATYLSFVFDSNEMSTQNITVKVPIAQLALTLQAPLVEKNTTYFPCYISTATPVLGRAFLQSAFVGVNYFEGDNAGTWFLAQAPGPALSNQGITAIDVRAATLGGSNSSWEQSWAKYWNIEDFPSSNPTSPSGSQSSGNSTTPSPSQSTNSSSGLSTGAKAGIGIGVAIVGVIFIAAAVWFAVLRPRRQNAAVGESMGMGESKLIALGSVERITEQPRGELESPVKPQEMMGEHTPRYELH